MSWVAVCDKFRPRCGRDRSETYVNVIKEFRNLKTETAAGFAERHPDHPWSDPAFGEYIVDMPDEDGLAESAGRLHLFWDKLPNLPKWQNQKSSTGSTYSRGHFQDLADAGSTFTPLQSLSDSRLIVRLYSDKPLNGQEPLASVSLETDAGDHAIWLKLFDESDNPMDYTGKLVDEIGGRLLALECRDGVARLPIDTSRAGRVPFHSSQRYKIVGPLGQNTVMINIFGNTLRV